MQKDDPPKPDDLNLYLQTIVHELRNPILSIEGYTKLISEKLRSPLDDDTATYWQRILVNLDRLNGLLDDISKLAKVSVDENEFTWTPLPQIINFALDSFDLVNHVPQVAVDIQPGLPAIFCDTKMMIQVFSNLIANAIKYASDGKEVRIEIGYVDGELFHKFFVKDNGIGLRARDRDKVFQPFCRLEDKKDVSGSGLGLTIVKRIIEGHGGEVWLDSRLNRGLTIFFTLPKQFNT
jgi:signal transduction histidine kinase